MASTLTDTLRGQSDEALAALVRARPDLVVPLPADFAGLAARAQSRISVTRVVDRLTRFQLEILDALRLTRDAGGLTSLDAVLAIAAVPAAGADAARVRAAVADLRGYLLVYGPDPELQVVATVDEVLGPYPAGLGRPAAELDPAAGELASDPARLRRTLLAAPPAGRAVLDRLAAGPPVGTTSGSGDPVAWLVDHGLLVPTSSAASSATVSASPPQPAGSAPLRLADTEDGGGTAELITVELPREVALVLRRDAGPLGVLHPEPPLPEAAPRDPDRVDGAGVGQALEAVRLTAALLEAFAADPPPILRTGGSGRAGGRGSRSAAAGPGPRMGIRDLRRLARAAGLEEPVAALLTEVAYAAGLFGEAEPGRGGIETTLRPTSTYDTWTGAPLALRWHRLATGWLSMPRLSGLVAQRDREREAGPAARRTVLGVLAALPPGTAATPDEVSALVGWYAPRRADDRSIGQVLTEATAFGVLGLGALTSYGAALLTERTATGGSGESDNDPLGVHAGDAPAGLTRAAARLDALLPPPVDEMVVQADLTVIVPGPPEPALAAELELVAEHESAGGASVHRVTRDSLRRALDAGYAAEDLQALFARRSRTPVPQGLRYMIDDVARAHGGLRVGTAHSYLRSEDEVLVAQVLADRRLATLALRRLAPTVLASAASSGRLLAALRETGYAPVPEDASGAAVLVRPRAPRAPARPATPPAADPFAVPRMSTPRLLGIIEDIRRGDAAARAARRAPATIRANGTAVSAQAHTEAMAVLQQAVRDRALVWVRYVDAHGSSTSRLVRPVSIGAGYLRAEDERTDTLHTFALHRITAASLDG
jgi:XPB/Ssl2-like helicase family protein